MERVWPSPAVEDGDSKMVQPPSAVEVQELDMVAQLLLSWKLPYNGLSLSIFSFLFLLSFLPFSDLQHQLPITGPPVMVVREARGVTPILFPFFPHWPPTISLCVYLF